MNFVHTNLAHLLQTFGGALWPPGALQPLAVEEAQAMAGGVALQGIQTLSHAGPAHLAFLSNPKYREQLQHTRAPVVLVREAQVQGLAAALPSLGTSPMLWAVPDPYLMYAKLQQWWVAQSQPSQPPGVHPSAVLHPGSQVHPSAHVGAQVCIAEGVVVGEGVVLEPGVVLGAGVRIGAHSRLCAHVVVYAECQLGTHCLVHAGAVIGADGFGFAVEAGQWVKIPQVGRVLVGDHVEIGANTTIDRGALGDTVIGTGVKLDNQIQIAHNVHIGEHTAMAGFAGVAGSTHIGARCMIGGAASILGHLHIADGTQVSANTCIMSSITEPGVYTGIYPAQPHKDWERTAATVRQLNKLRKQWRKG